LPAAVPAEIRRAYAEGEASVRQLAAEHGISIASASRRVWNGAGPEHLVRRPTRADRPAASPSSPRWRGRGAI
jgi:transposase-like protein